MCCRFLWNCQRFWSTPIRHPAPVASPDTIVSQDPSFKAKIEAEIDWLQCGMCYKIPRNCQRFWSKNLGWIGRHPKLPPQPPSPAQTLLPARTPSLVLTLLPVRTLLPVQTPSPRFLNGDAACCRLCGRLCLGESLGFMMINLLIRVRQQPLWGDWHLL